MWRAGSPDPGDVLRMARVREQFDLAPLVIHDNYLINLASIDPVVRARSIEAFRGELERAAAIGAEYLVAHPGSYKGQSVEVGIISFVAGLAEAARGFRNDKLMLLIEGTAGCGCAIGSRFQEMRAIREQAAAATDVAVGYCLDTCHLLAAGYDIASEDGLRHTVREAGRWLGFENIRVMHANDSKHALGSRRDRHANIGEGYIGRDGFQRILGHPKLRRLPFILETPVDEVDDDRRNLDTLKSLCPRSRTTISRSS